MQTVYLTGVLDDGTKLQPDVPANTAKTIQLPLLSPVTLEVSVVTNAGIPVDLTAAGGATWAAYFSVVKNPCSCAQAAGIVDYQLASMTLKAGTKNTITFAVPGTALRALVAGRYFYDVALVLDSARYQVVRISGLHLEAVLRRA